MSRAFVKEDAGGDEALPDRPVSPHPNYVTAEGLAQIDAELPGFRPRRSRPVTIAPPAPRSNATSATGGRVAPALK